MGYGRIYLIKEEPPEGGDSYTEGHVHRMDPLVYWVESRPTMEASGWSVLVEDVLIEESESHGEPEKVDESGLMC